MARQDRRSDSSMHFQGKERQLHYRWFEGEAITGGKGRRPPFITMGRKAAMQDWID
ncbi:hypothetical protein [uncultured Rothia sp.]|uniref:hypothetical protein n=1 Tax=uncultured Rothia sp. TaxID=316088 RepID=UPI0028DC5BC5|nr:hypothetical protein [uncultured Rothia sp.]